MTLALPLPGHADDCPACKWGQLPDEDRGALDEAAFRIHIRREPPEQPAPLRDPTIPLAAGGAVLLFVLAAVLHLPLLALVGVVALIGVAALGYRLKDRQLRVDQGWRAQVQAWKDAQTQAWLQRRAVGELWPCPTCGTLSCSNQHSTTTTSTVRVGRFYSSRSHSDPV